MNTSVQGININPIFENNMKALSERYPHISERVLAAKVNVEYTMQGTGNKNYVNVFCLKSNSFYYDLEDPIRDVENQLEELNLKNAKIAVFLGFGLGYEVEYYAKMLSSKCSTKHIIIIERDVELFKIALHMFDYTPMIKSENIDLIVGEKEEDLFPIFEKIYRQGSRVVYLKAIKPVYHTSSIQNNKDYYLSALRTVRECGSYILKFYGNSLEDSLIGIENILNNIKEIIVNPGIKFLYNRFKDKPAVVVSTGPSLNKNKHLLKVLEDKALIVAADASLRILMEMGVKPHLVTSLERFPQTIPLLEGFNKEQVEDVYFASCPVVDNGLYRVFPGPRVIVYRNFDHFRWLNIDRGILDIKHSSGNMAFKIAAALGCNPIILIGQDLAYSRDGKTHATGNFYGEAQADLVEGGYAGERYEVMGNDGMPILTNEDWDSFRKAYEVDIAEYKGKCINSTEGGAYIEGTEVMPFQKAIDQYIGEPIHPIENVKLALQKFTEEEAQRDLKSVEQLLEKTKKDLYIIRQECYEAYNLLEKYQKELDSYLDEKKVSFTEEEKKSIDDKTIKIMKYKQKIFSIQPTMQMFMMHIFQPFYIKFEIDLHEIPDRYTDNNKINVIVTLSHMKFFVVLHDLLNLCIDMLEKAQQKVKEIDFKS